MPLTHRRRRARAALCAWKRAEPLYSAYNVWRHNNFLDRWLPRGENALRLYNRLEHRYDEALVHEKVRADAADTGRLSGNLWHYGFRKLEDQLERFNRYTTLDARDAYSRGKRFRPWRALWRPPAKFVQKYFVHGFFRAGLAGFAISAFWAYYAFMKEIKVFELHLLEKQTPKERALGK